MKFQLCVEIDETQAKMTQRQIIDFVLESLSHSLGELNSYYDISVPVDRITNGLTS